MVNFDNIKLTSFGEIEQKKDHYEVESTFKLKGKEYTITLSYKTKPSKEHAQENMQKMAGKMAALAVTYRLGTKTESITLENLGENGGQLIRQYKNEEAIKYKGQRVVTQLNKKDLVSRATSFSQKNNEEVAAAADYLSKVFKFDSSEADDPDLIQAQLKSSEKKREEQQDKEQPEKAPFQRKEEENAPQDLEKVAGQRRKDEPKPPRNIHLDEPEALD